MLIAPFEGLEGQWVEGRSDLRWRSTLGTTPEGGARECSSSLLEVDPGCALPRHTDSAEEIVVVVSGVAEVELDGETGRVEAGGVALVPKDHWFMMGDNRGASDDSRFWGPVPRDWFIGSAFATYWPPKKIGLL